MSPLVYQPKHKFTHKLQKPLNLTIKPKSIAQNGEELTLFPTFQCAVNSWSSAIKPSPTAEPWSCPGRPSWTQPTSRPPLEHFRWTTTTGHHVAFNWIQCNYFHISYILKHIHFHYHYQHMLHCTARLWLTLNNSVVNMRDGNFWESVYLFSPYSTYLGLV